MERHLWSRRPRPGTRRRSRSRGRRLWSRKPRPGACRRSRSKVVKNIRKTFIEYSCIIWELSLDLILSCFFLFPFLLFSFFPLLLVFSHSFSFFVFLFPSLLFSPILYSVPFSAIISHSHSFLFSSILSLYFPFFLITSLSLLFFLLFSSTFFSHSFLFFPILSHLSFYFYVFRLIVNYVVYVRMHAHIFISVTYLIYYISQLNISD